MSRAGDFSGRLLRANPLYELVLLERLAEAERRALSHLAAGLEEDPAMYGILRPRDPAAGLGTKSADRDTALLFLSLREPGPLPSYVRRAFGEAGLQAVTRLVADGVLEIEVEEGRGFVSGAAALRWLGGPREHGGSGGRLAVLSLAALKYGHALTREEPGLDPLTLAGRLYGYNACPLTPRWHRLLPSGDAVQSWLGIGPGGPNRRRLERSWSALEPSAGWLHWSHRSPAQTVDGPTYKLYVSPEPDALAEGFGPILDALTAARPFQFKIGAGAAGLLRPDKLVAYFPTFERLAEAAAAITDRLALPAQGVPFTAEIAGDGLLSWGVDPPAAERSRWAGGESWRFWLVQRLARALLAGTPRFALERLRLEGIDTDTWTPGARLWRAD